MKKLLWCVAAVVVLAEATGIHGLATGLRVAIVVLDVLLLLVVLSGGGFVIVIYRKGKPRKRSLIPAPDPELTHRTHTTVTAMTMKPATQRADKVALPGERTPTGG
jgi:hypothetical protein